MNKEQKITVYSESKTKGGGGGGGTEITASEGILDFKYVPKEQTKTN